MSAPSLLWYNFCVICRYFRAFDNRILGRFGRVSLLPVKSPRLEVFSPLHPAVLFSARVHRLKDETVLGSDGAFRRKRIGLPNALPEKPVSLDVGVVTRRLHLRSPASARELYLWFLSTRRTRLASANAVTLRVWGNGRRKGGGVLYALGISRVPPKRITSYAYSSKKSYSKPKTLPSRPTSTWHLILAFGDAPLLRSPKRAGKEKDFGGQFGCH